MAYAYQTNTFDLGSVGIDPTNTTTYAWNSGRLTNVSWQVGTALRAVRYDYLTGADMVEQLTYEDTSALTISKTYDPANRLLSISATSAVSVVNSFSYSLDATGRRTRRQDADGGRTDWAYDSFDQLISAARTNSPNGAADAAYQRQYQYDLVGNRLHEDRGRQDLDGAFNNLNQLTHLTFGGQINILGTVSPTNSYVLVQGYTNAPPFYNGTNWFGGAVVNPGSNSIPIVAWEGTNSTQSNLVVYLPPTNPEIFLYDANGNLLSDGQRTFAWDEENRLTAIETVAAAVPDAARARSDFLYDAQSRRAKRTDFTGWNGASYNATNTTRFVYDGWNLLAELTAANTVSNYYCWGLDLSGSMQGAGGIGGLLAVTRPLTLDTFHFTFDGNGNVTDLVDTNGAVVAHYEYDPFGRTVAATGPLALENKWRFSTKLFEDLWDLYYYGYRYYSPGLGRWLSRDPIGEGGGIPLYVYVLNDPVQLVDLVGLTWAKCFSSAVMEVHITPSTNPNLPGTIEAGIIIDLDAEACRCICEFPKFKQEARLFEARTTAWSHTQAGNYRSDSGWQPDNKGKDYYPGVYIKFQGNMEDNPGEFHWDPWSWWQRMKGYRVELVTVAYCTEGQEAGAVLRARNWGLEVKEEVLTGFVHRRWWGAASP